MKPKDISSLKYDLGKKAYGITGKHIQVFSATDELGYTTPDNKIYLGFNHPYLEELTKYEQIAFIRGVFCHEVMHQLLSDFGIVQNTIEKMKSGEQQIFASINNVLEDSFIEYYAPVYIDGQLIHDLSFMRAFVYKQTPPVGEETPFNQFMNAFIQYGDAGLIKGTFTDPEARRCFLEAIPIMDQGVTEKDPYKRIELSKQIFEISRPLWQDMADLAEFLKMLKECGKDAKVPSGGGSSGSPLTEPESEPDNDKRAKRRKITFKRVSKEEYEAAKEAAASSSGEDGGDGDITVLVPDEADEDFSEDGIPVPSDKGEKSDETDNSTTSETTGSDGKSETADSSDTGDSSEKTGKSSKASFSKKESAGFAECDEIGKNLSENESDGLAGEKSGEDEEEEEDIDELDMKVDYELTDEDIARITQDMERAEAVLKREEAEDAKADSESVNLEFDVSGGYKNCCKGKSVANVRVRSGASLETAYAKLITPYKTKINHLANQLKRLFANEREEKEHRNSGRVNATRLYGGKVTTRVFDKRVNPVSKSDIAVCIAVDESGSMGSSLTPGSKADAARRAAICLAEAFAELKLPLSIFGFSADEYAPGSRKSFDSVHYHYLTWRNTRKDRQKLLNITGRANNFDGYAIRYAAQMLAKRPESHKLLIVISDGEPAACAYKASGDGIMDTSMAIKEASNRNTVVGILVGRTSADTHRQMYGYNFLHVKQVEDLFSGLSKVIVKKIKEW